MCSCLCQSRDDAPLPCPPNVKDISLFCRFVIRSRGSIRNRLGVEFAATRGRRTHTHQKRLPKSQLSLFMMQSRCSSHRPVNHTRCLLFIPLSPVFHRSFIVTNCITVRNVISRSGNGWREERDDVKDGTERAKSVTLLHLFFLSSSCRSGDERTTLT